MRSLNRLVADARAAVILLIGRTNANDETRMDEEFAFHLDMATEQNVRAGMSLADARRAALVRFGGREQTKEDARDERRSRPLADLLGDLRFAVRSLRRRNPAVAIAVTLSFAIGVGVNAGLFTVVDRVFFHAPPGVAHPESVRRLVYYGRGGQALLYTNETFTIADHEGLASAVRNDASVEGYYFRSDMTVGGDGDHRNVGYATAGFFDLAGIKPFRGRLFSPDEHRYGEPHRVAVLSHRYWRDRFDASPAVLGKMIRVDSTLLTIVGVASPEFGGMDLDVIDVWAPLADVPAGLEGSLLSGGFQILKLFTRINERAVETTVNQRLASAFARIHAPYFARDSARLEVVPLLRARSAPRVVNEPDRNLLLITRLSGVAVVVFVLAVSNAASLLLMRTLRRRRELAVRLALGISRARLVRQCALESLLMAFAGAVAAILAAWWTGGAIRRALVPDITWTSTVVDARVVGLAFLLAVAGGVIAGVLPAIASLRGDLMLALKSGGREAGRARAPLRGVLLVLQTSLCMLLLAAAGVFIQSLRNAATFDLGLDADRLIMFSPPTTDQALLTTIAQQTRALPGVSAVSRSAAGINGGGGISIFFPSGDSVVSLNGPNLLDVDSAYARTLGLRLQRGRFFTSADLAGSEPVIVVSASTANAYWPGRDPVGECIYVGKRQTSSCRRVVGVVADARRTILGTPPLVIYRPIPQSDFKCCFTYFIARTGGVASATVLSEIREMLRPLAVNPRFGFDPIRFSDRLQTQLRPWRLATFMFGVFGALALMTAMAGVYGLIAYDVAERTHELGVRITLGASSASLVSLVMRSGLRIVVIGIVAGTIAMFFGGRLLSAMLFQTSAWNPGVLATAAACVLATVLAASFIPALRATRLDPAVVLRAE
jgi:predicted permease